MRKDFTGYLANFLECLQVNIEHQHLVGSLHLPPILDWNWEVITLDFIMFFPKTKKNNDSIIVVVYKLTKASHFIHVQSTYKVTQISDIFMHEIFRLHGIPK